MNHHAEPPGDLLRAARHLLAMQGFDLGTISQLGAHWHAESRAIEIFVTTAACGHIPRLDVAIALTTKEPTK